MLRIYQPTWHGDCNYTGQDRKTNSTEQKFILKIRKKIL